MNIKYSKVTMGCEPMSNEWQNPMSHTQKPKDLPN